MEITENDVRLIRQRLYLLERGKTKKPEAIWKYLTETRGLSLEDMPVRELLPDYVACWEIPPGAETVTILVRHGREPIWRIPTDLDTRELSVYERCYEIPKELKDVAF